MFVLQGFLFLTICFKLPFGHIYVLYIRYMLFVETSSSIYSLNVWLQKTVVYIHIPSRWLRETDFNIELKMLSRNWEVKERERTS